MLCEVGAALSESGVRDLSWKQRGFIYSWSVSLSMFGGGGGEAVQRAEREARGVLEWPLGDCVHW